MLKERDEKMFLKTIPRRYVNMENILINAERILYVKFKLCVSRKVFSNIILSRMRPQLVSSEQRDSEGQGALLILGEWHHGVRLY